MVLRQYLEHHHARPPIVIACGTNHAVGLRMVESPVDEAHRLFMQSRILEKDCQRIEPIHKVGAALPAFPCSSQPSTILPNIRPELIEMTAHTSRLGLELIEQPARRQNLTQP